MKSVTVETADNLSSDSVDLSADLELSGVSTRGVGGYQGSKKGISYRISSDKSSYQIRELGHMYFPSLAFPFPGCLDVTRTMAEPITANELASTCKQGAFAVSPALA
jgi:hypothetical protein